MEDLRKRTWAEIRLGNIEHNVNAMRACLPSGCRFLGVVKANAYGHGAGAVARRLEQIGCDYLAVAAIDEAAELRRAGITLPILILGRTPPEYAQELARMEITQAVGALADAQAMSALLLPGETVKIHLKLETGMGRTGFPADSEAAFGEMLRVLALPNLAPEGIFTHFAVSDEFGDPFTARQLERFTRMASALEKASGRTFAIKHCANSGAMINYPETYLDMVRPGLATYGLYPAAERGRLKLLPAMELKSRVYAITEHAPGDSVSYGRTFIAEKPMRLAVVPIGYADGLHRVLSGKMDVLIRGTRARQVGRICMDMCMVDVTHIPDCRVGDVVTIFGRDGDAFLPVEEQAEKAGTISYELVCAVSPRVPRVVVD